MMKKTLATLAVAATVAIGAVAIPTPADARWHRGFPVGPVIGGLAAGAILGGLIAGTLSQRFGRRLSSYSAPQ